MSRKRLLTEDAQLAKIRREIDLVTLAVECKKAGKIDMADFKEDISVSLTDEEKKELRKIIVAGLKGER